MATTIVLGNGPLGRAMGEALAQRGDAVDVVGRPAGVRHGPARLRRGRRRRRRVTRRGGGDERRGRARRRLPGVRHRDHRLARGPGPRRGCVATRGRGRGRGAQPGARRRAVPAAWSTRRPVWRARSAGSSRPSSSGTADPRPTGRRARHARSSAASRPRTTRSTSTRLPCSGRARCPGMHVVGFDGASETIELRLTARDRSGYAAGALAAIDWLRAAPRTPGIHAFDEVVDERIAAARAIPRELEPVAATA